MLNKLKYSNHCCDLVKTVFKLVRLLVVKILMKILVKISPFIVTLNSKF